MASHPKPQGWMDARPSDGGVFTELLTQALKDQLGSVNGQKFLDLSLDRGQTTQYLRRSGGAGWTCRDPRGSNAFVREASSFVGQGHRLPVADGVVDLLTATLCCSRHPDLNALTSEAARALRPGGRLFIAEYHPYIQPSGSAKQDPDLANPPRHTHLASDYVHALQRAGFSIQDLDEPRWRRRPFLWILLAQKNPAHPGMLFPADESATAKLWTQAPDEPDGAAASLPPLITEARRTPALESWLDRALESLWSTVFRLSKKQHGPGRTEWTPWGGQRVLVLAARPGDEVIGCAGALMAHHGAGDHVTVAQLSDGRRSGRSEIGRRADGGRHALNPRQRAALRRREAQEAAHLLGFELHGSSIDDREMDALDLRPVLCQLLETHRPDLIYTPSRCSRDPVAQRLAASLAQVLERPAVHAPNELRIYGLDVPLTPILANLILPLAPNDMARAAMHTYLSHLGPSHPCWRHRRYSGYLWKRRFPVEEAWQVTPDEFQLLHDRLVVGSGGDLHALRQRPWKDPWAYFGGHSERTRWIRRLLVPR